MLKLYVANVFQCHPTNRYFDIQLVRNAKGQEAKSYSFCQLDEASMKVIDAFDNYHRQKMVANQKMVPRKTEFIVNSVSIPVVFIHSHCGMFYEKLPNIRFLYFY